MFLLRWLWKNMEGSRKLYIFGIVLTVLSQSMYIITPRITSEITDTFIVNKDALLNLETRSDYLIVLLIAMVGFTLLRGVMQYGSTMMYERSSQAMIFKIRNIVFKNIEDQDAKFYDSYRTGDIMTRISGDLDMVRHSICWILRAVLECIVMFIASIIFFFSIDWLMALCLVGLTPFIMLITAAFRKKVAPKYQNQREKLSRLNTEAEENISGNRVVKAFAREEYEKEKFDKLSREYRDASKDAAFTWLKFFPFLEICAQSLSVVMLVCGGLFVIFGRLTFGEYTAFSGLVWTMSNPMRTLGNIVNDWQRFTASAHKIIEIYYGRPRIATREDAVDMPRRFKGRVEFDNVTLKLGGETIIDGVSFTAEQGETVAIMGETGAGKTLLTELIPRIYDVNSGAVRVDGVDVRMLKLDQLRRNVGVATQDVFLFSDTIDGNISYGDTDMPEEDVVKVAELADADGFVRKLSDGYDTIVGERGVGLSGGQKQRISLARALAVKPAVLILDDTTSAVDLETEKHIQHSLKSLDFPCTKIIVAQRISTAMYADKIIVLKNGKIIEQGSHKELIKQNGYYKEVYDLQK
ncbi:MAG: ABC transporter ATP-binding protein/permease [Lachnospiraceae bacterium]|nr:ABC transporter ATP-binding protein/permease [Ruminococcus sp.]MCM1274745.1 ABC transporter ATP-binding protein/permease [Lachnospiraceae bacterium]